jgi:hypothetical protein
MIKLTDKESFTMLMEIFMKEIGLMIKLMEKGLIFIKTVPNTKESGEMINSMGSGLRPGQMEQSMKASTVKGRKTEKES